MYNFISYITLSDPFETPDFESAIKDLPPGGAVYEILKQAILIRYIRFAQENNICPTLLCSYIEKLKLLLKEKRPLVTMEQHSTLGITMAEALLSDTMVINFNPDSLRDYLNIMDGQGLENNILDERHIGFIYYIANRPIPSDTVVYSAMPIVKACDDTAIMYINMKARFTAVDTVAEGLGIKCHTDYLLRTLYGASSTYDSIVGTIASLYIHGTLNKDEFGLPHVYRELMVNRHCMEDFKPAGIHDQSVRGLASAKLKTLYDIKASFCFQYIVMMYFDKEYYKYFRELMRTDIESYNTRLHDNLTEGGLFKIIRYNPKSEIEEYIELEGEVEVGVEAASDTKNADDNTSDSPDLSGWDDDDKKTEAKKSESEDKPEDDDKKEEAKDKDDEEEDEKSDEAKLEESGDPAGTPQSSDTNDVPKDLATELELILKLAPEPSLEDHFLRMQIINKIEEYLEHPKSNLSPNAETLLRAIVLQGSFLFDIPTLEAIFKSINIDILA